MSAVKTLIQPRPVGKDLLLSTNIPFLDRNNLDAFTTHFQEDFKPASSKKAEPARHPPPAQVDHKDLRHIKEYQTEGMVSYQPLPLAQRIRIPCWTKLYTNFKMETDPWEPAFLTSHCQNIQPQPFQSPPTPILQSESIQKLQRVEKIPESTNRASFKPQHGPPVVKATVKHLEEGFPTIKGDGRHRSFVSEYNNTFQGAWSRVAQSVEKHTSSVAMGDPVRIVEREMTNAASFSWPTNSRPPVGKERLKLSLGSFPQDLWSSTSREAFHHHKLAEPHRASSFCTGPLLMTKSHVRSSPPHLSGPHFTTTAKEHHSKQDGEQARPAIQLPSNILSGPEHGLSLSTTRSDYLPFGTCRPTPCLSQQRSHIRFPLVHLHFSTAHSEAYTTKPLAFHCPGRNQFFSHFVMQ